VFASVGSFTMSPVTESHGASFLSIMGQDHTRDDACHEAFSNCNALVTNRLAITQSGGMYAEIRSECRGTECNR